VARLEDSLALMARMGDSLALMARPEDFLDPTVPLEGMDHLEGPLDPLGLPVLLSRTLLARPIPTTLRRTTIITTTPRPLKRRTPREMPWPERQKSKLASPKPSQAEIVAAGSHSSQNVL
jgi:hypothetical protein